MSKSITALSIALGLGGLATGGVAIWELKKLKSDIELVKLRNTKAFNDSRNLKTDMRELREAYDKLLLTMAIHEKSMKTITETVIEIEDEITEFREITENLDLLDNEDQQKELLLNLSRFKEEVDRISKMDVDSVDVSEEVKFKEIKDLTEKSEN